MDEVALREEKILQDLDAALRQQYPAEYAAGLIGPVRDESGRITAFKGIRLNEKGRYYLDRGRPQ